MNSNQVKMSVEKMCIRDRRSIVPAMLAWLYYGRSYECMVEQGEELTKRKDIPTLYLSLIHI